MIYTYRTGCRFGWLGEKFVCYLYERLPCSEWSIARIDVRENTPSGHDFALPLSPNPFQCNAPIGESPSEFPPAALPSELAQFRTTGPLCQHLSRTPLVTRRITGLGRG